MKKDDELKKIVKEKYGKIAEQSICCCCCEPEYSTFNDNYDEKEGYVADADLKLGCGMPVDYAGIQKGDHVLDLGCGAGNDCFVARAETGEEGKVTGLDFSDEMLAKANANINNLGFKNIEFVKGDIDDMPFHNDQFDVIISNCVLNLVPDKQKAYREIYRVLKLGGHFCISDVVIRGSLPESIKNDAEMYAGCVSGALLKEEYLDIISASGFKNVEIKTEKIITLPDELLMQNLNTEEIENFKKSNTGIFSITIVGSK